MSLASLLLPDGEFRVIRCDIADKLIACGDGDSALLYLYALRRGERMEEATAMRDLGFSKERFDRALFTLTSLTVQNTPQSAPVSDVPKYTASELRQAREGDHRFAAVCSSAEEMFGRALTESQVRSLFSIYDHLALPAEVIIELLSYLKRDRGKVLRRDIEREAVLWSDMGIYTSRQAQDYLARVEAEKPLMDAILTAMHIVGREPSAAERQLITQCIEKGFPPEAVALAMQRMEQSIGKFSLRYLKSILSRWDKKGVHSVAEITALEPEPASRPQPTPTAAVQSDKLENWEKEWLEEVERRKRERTREG